MSESLTQNFNHLKIHSQYSICEGAVKIDNLQDFSKANKSSMDYAGRIVINDKKQAIINFGKHKGVKVNAVLEAEPGYYSWIQNADFPLYTKKILTAIKLRKLNTK